MSRDEQFDEPLSDERPSRLPTPEMRVDAAHVRADERPAAEQRVEQIAPQAAPVECTGHVTAQQARLQAAQLASHLQRQQSTVDHRESELNARVAAMENQIRAARLWLDERHAELAAQTALLDRRERELAEREEEPSGDFNAGFRRAPAAAGRQGAEGADSLEAFRDNLQRAESLLLGQQAELERERRQSADSRAAFADAMHREREKLAGERKRFVAEQNRSRQELDRQADELAARHAALERMRADVARAHQEALELRLATEELWARLCGTMAPAALAQSLAQTRLKLAEEQRLARSQLAAERAEVQALAGRVAEQHDKLVDERKEIQSWVKGRHEELERYAGLLSAREREMADQRAAFEEKADTWQSERFRIEQEIRQLLRQAGGAQSVAAA
ncbi:MAG: hypothetical protein WD063_10765 [Pirellulales bacterium]